MPAVTRDSPAGSETESVYRRYAIVCEADLSQAVRRIAALSASR